MLDVLSFQLEKEKSIKNATIWALNEYYANYSMTHNTTDIPPPDIDPADVIRGPCWETAVGIVMLLYFSQCSRVHLFCLSQNALGCSSHCPNHAHILNFSIFTENWVVYLCSKGNRNKCNSVFFSDIKDENHFQKHSILCILLQGIMIYHDDWNLVIGNL